MEREYSKEKPTKDGHYWLKLDGKEELVELQTVNGNLVEVRDKRKSLGIISNPACLFSGPVPESDLPKTEAAPPQSETDTAQTVAAEIVSENSTSEDFNPPETAKDEIPPKEEEAKTEG